MQWQSCLPEPLPWISLRELLLQVLFSPPLLLPLVVLVAVLLARWFKLRRAGLIAVGVLAPSIVSLVHTPMATTLLTAWLQQQQPEPELLANTREAVVVLVGRGPAIAGATTVAAAERLSSGEASVVYVSGDQRDTAERIEQMGIAPNRIAGDSCARTTWENATLTASWLRQHHPGAPVLLITDPWQLPRASRAFQRQGLQVQPIAAAPQMHPAQQNRLALRETVATLLYYLQGRM
jgi:uncharacterized SAM-binding protein YcdF (DUF218 family)